MQKSSIRGSQNAGEGCPEKPVQKDDPYQEAFPLIERPCLSEKIDNTLGSFPEKHCIVGTRGWEIADGLEVPDAKYIDKPAFGWMGWDKYALEEVELVGLCTDICVISNALILKAAYPEIKVTVDAGCCAGVTSKTHQAALETMKMCQVDVIGE